MENKDIRETLCGSLRASRKYTDVYPPTIDRLVREYLPRYRKASDAEHAVREALHGITGAFMAPAEIRKCEASMDAWRENPGEEALEEILRCHASTRERMPLGQCDALFSSVFDLCGKPRSVLDLACGLNPVYLSARRIPCTGVDISGACTQLVNRFSPMAPAPVKAVQGDLLIDESIPEEYSDLVLLFKVLPLLDRQCAGTAARLLTRIFEINRPRFACVSFPTRTLGGKKVGMEKNYASWMDAHLPDGLTLYRRFVCADELICLITKEE